MTDAFDTFWEAYPRHEAKKDARKAWGQVNPSEETLGKILAALEWQKQCDQWLRGYIPLPATYLRGERWEDEPMSRPALGQQTTRLLAAVAQIKRVS